MYCEQIVCPDFNNLPNQKQVIKVIEFVLFRHFEKLCPKFESPPVQHPQGEIFLRLRILIHDTDHS